MFTITKSKLRAWWNTGQFPIESHDAIARSQRWTRRQEFVAGAVLVVACLAVILPRLSYPLIEPDETRYAQIPLEMLDSGDWITPTIDGKPYLDKPPLMYWLTAASFRVFGANEFAARMPSVLSAIATILTLHLLGRRLIGARAAWLGALSLLLSGGYVLAGRFLMLDSLLSFCTTLCLLSGYIAVREQRHRWSWWMLSAVACALGTLTKGPVALVLCVPPLIASGWLRHDQTRTRLIHWAAFVVPVVLMSVPWYCAVWMFNPEFGKYFFWEHNFNRFIEGSNHEQPFWFYLPVMFAAMFPVSLLLPTLGSYLVSRSEGKRQLRSKDVGFLFCGSVWILLFFSLSSCKLPAYMMPAIPLICLMVGAMLDVTVFEPQRESRITSFLKPYPQRANMILVVFCLVVVGVDGWLQGSIQTTPVLAIAVCLVVTAITCYFWNREVAFAAEGWGFHVIVALALLGFTSARLFPTIATTRSLYAKAAAVVEQHPDDDVVFFAKSPCGVRFQLPLDRVTYYPRRSRAEFLDCVASSDRLILVIGETEIANTRQAIAGTHALVPLNDDELYIARRKARHAARRENSSSLQIR